MTMPTIVSWFSDTNLPRTLPGETGPQIEAELESLLERCRQADPEFEASHRTLLVREPFEIDQNEELVSLISRAAGEVRGEPVPIGGAVAVLGERAAKMAFEIRSEGRHLCVFDFGQCSTVILERRHFCYRRSFIELC